MNCFLVLVLFFASQVFGGNLIIGIAGGSASGKTTLANKIKESFGVEAVLIGQDNYYKDLSGMNVKDRRQTNFDHPDSLDFNLLINHLTLLKQNQAVLKPNYDFESCTRIFTEEYLSPSKIIIVEGILIFAIKEIRELCDLRFFADTDSDIRLSRRIRRDVKERNRTQAVVEQQFFATVQPMHNQFVEPSKIYAHFIISTNTDTSSGEELILSEIRAKLF